jgi:hypothetical protein
MPKFVGSAQSDAQCLFSLTLQVLRRHSVLLKVGLSIWHAGSELCVALCETLPGAKPTVSSSGSGG